MDIIEMKQQLAEVAHSFYQRGFVVGSAGNMSVLLDDWTFLATPTGLGGTMRMDHTPMAKSQNRRFLSSLLIVSIAVWHPFFAGEEVLLL